MTLTKILATIAVLAFLGLVVSAAYAVLMPAASLIGNVSEAGR